MLASRSIQSLYPLALAEGEGVGTAYEYYAKRLLLARFLRQIPRPERILVAGLPEKYGSSLDFLLLASELQAEVVVVDHRETALAKARNALDIARGQNLLSVNPQYAPIPAIETMGEVNGRFDLALCCEVLQAVPTEKRIVFWQGLQTVTSAIALFVPNAGNPAHSYLSGLRTVSLEELKSLLPTTPLAQIGLVDLPPFPSGMVRSAEQRQQATTGKLENFAMWSLNYYARFEKFLPKWVRYRYAHMVYALVPNQL